LSNGLNGGPLPPRHSGRIVGYPEAIVETQAPAPGLTHYYNRRGAIFKPHPRLAADNDLAPSLRSR